MVNENPEIQSDEQALPSPLRCWTGTIVAGAMSFAAYLLTSRVILGFASTPPTGNSFAIRIAITVRTLITGLCTMATGVFGLIALGLLLLGFQSLFQGQKDNINVESIPEAATSHTFSETVESTDSSNPDAV